LDGTGQRGGVREVDTWRKIDTILFLEDVFREPEALLPASNMPASDMDIGDFAGCVCSNIHDARDRRVLDNTDEYQ
jgi:hypothetical protein